MNEYKFCVVNFSGGIPRKSKRVNTVMVEGECEFERGTELVKELEDKGFDYLRSNTFRLKDRKYMDKEEMIKLILGLGVGMVYSELLEAEYKVLGYKIMEMRAKTNYELAVKVFEREFSKTAPV